MKRLHLFIFLRLLSPAESFVSSRDTVAIPGGYNLIGNGGTRMLMLPKRLPSAHLPKQTMSRRYLKEMAVRIPPKKSSSFHLHAATSADDYHSISFSDFSKAFCRLSPLWTLLSAGIAMNYPNLVGPTIGSLPVMQTSLSILMLAMGLTITPVDISRAIQKPFIIVLNSLLCFGIMPIVAIIIAAFLKLSSEHNAGLVLLGCVSGGQASNLFTMLAGGDVALSVACTLSTTLLGTVAIPLLVKLILNCIVVVDSIAVLKSVAQLVLLPLVLGLGMGKFQPSFVQKIQSICPLVGVLATLVLVAGGASNCSFVSSGFGRSEYYTFMLASYLLPIVGGFVAWAISYLKLGQRGATMEEKTRRALVVETLSKSPTLSYVLAKKHFSDTAAAIPAAGMVSLAVVGAAIASLWSSIDPIQKYYHSEHESNDN